MLCTSRATAYTHGSTLLHGRDLVVLVGMRYLLTAGRAVHVKMGVRVGEPREMSVPIRAQSHQWVRYSLPCTPDTLRAARSEQYRRCSISDGSSGRRGAHHVWAARDAGERAVAADVPDFAVPLRPLRPRFEVSLSHESGPAQGGPRCRRPFRARAVWVDFDGGPSWLPTVESLVDNIHTI
jgi:hypothetical protein